MSSNSACLDIVIIDVRFYWPMSMRDTTMTGGITQRQTANNQHLFNLKFLLIKVIPSVMKRSHWFDRDAEHSVILHTYI